MTSITIELPDHLADRLCRRAMATGRDVADLVGDFVIDQLDDTQLMPPELEANLDAVVDAVVARANDGTTSRPAREFFDELRAEMSNPAID